VSVHPITTPRGARRYQVRYRDHTGKQKAENYTRKADATTRDGAITLAKERGEPIPKRGPDRKGQTFERFALDEWLAEDVIGRRLSAKTAEGYAYQLDKYLIPRIGDEALVYIDAERAIGLRTQLAADGVPDYTSARALKLFRQIMGHAVKKGRLPYNPADVLSGSGALPSQARITDVRPMPPEQTEELRRAILAMQSPEWRKARDAMLVVLIAYAGLRPEEALALKWTNVKPKTLRVEHANANGVIGATKTGWRRTVSGLIPTLVDDLKEWQAITPHGKAGDLVIPQEDGSPWTRADYGNWRGRIFRKFLPADVHPGTRPYDLRHGYASLRVRQGDDPATIAKAMGNSPVTLMGNYVHVFEEYEDAKPEPMAEVVARARKAADEKAAKRAAGVQAERERHAKAKREARNTARRKARMNNK